jgi:hypothetical protein
MSIADQSLPARRAFRIAAPGENALLAIVALSFLLLHILAGLMVQRALPGALPDQTETVIPYGD